MKAKRKNEKIVDITQGQKKTSLGTQNDDEEQATVEM